MNRTDRLYALVEELRAVAPRPRSSSWLARRFEVSVRTIERDLGALRESGVPVYADPGRNGGYTLDRERTLPPLMLSAEEAVAISVALSTAASTPFSRAARSAAQKVRAVLPDGVRRRESLIAGRIHRLGDGLSARDAAVDEAVQRAVATGTVLRLAYTDAAGSVTERDVEPIGMLWSSAAWYLMGWCRLRGAVRGFRLDRIAAAALTGEKAPGREQDMQAELRRLAARPLEL